MPCGCCGGDHGSSHCPFRLSATKADAIKTVFSTAVEPPEEGSFVPLRKKQKRHSTGKEDNLVKSYYKDASAKTEDEIAVLRADHGITVEGGDCPAPVTSFSQCSLPEYVVSILENDGFKTPTAIQMQALPIIMSGRDLVGQAETGSGKTLAFVLPLLAFLVTCETTKAGQGPLALILGPTRELVEQIFSVIHRFLEIPDVSKPVIPAANRFLEIPDVSNPVVPASNRVLDPGVPHGSSSLEGQPLPPPSEFTPTDSAPQAVPSYIDSASGFRSGYYSGYSHPGHYAGPHDSASAWTHVAADGGVSGVRDSSSVHGNCHSANSWNLPNGGNGFPAISQTRFGSGDALSVPHTGPSSDSSTFSQTAMGVTQAWADYLAPHNEHQPQEQQPPITHTSAWQQLPRSQGHRVLGVCGGVSLANQIQPLTAGVDVVVATPGRLIDFLERGVTSLDRVQYFVMDEADRMLSMGMEPQLRRLVGLSTSQVRQTLLFSATMPTAIERLARSAVLDPIYVYVGVPNVIPPHIKQCVLFMHSYMKKNKLLEVLRSIAAPPVLVFCNSHHSVDRVIALLRQEQFHCAGLHSQKHQAYRFRVMSAYKNGGVDVLVATDVASRGIDVSDCTHVIQYDMAETIEDYVHRSGRTGRGKKFGTVTSFLTYDCKIASDLKQMLMKTKQRIPPELMDTRKFGGDMVHTEHGDVPKYG